jgi:hypothetical protein
MPFCHWSWIELVHSSGATAGLPLASMEAEVGTVSPATISTLQPYPSLRIRAWMCASAAADAQVISAMSMVRSVPHETASCAAAGRTEPSPSARPIAATMFPVLKVSKSILPSSAGKSRVV